MECGVKKHRPLVVAIGEVLWDVFEGGARLGGAPANFAVHASAMGLRAALVSCVGADDLGRRAVAALSARGVATEWVQMDEDRPTGVAPVTLVNGQPSYEIVEGVAWDRIGWRGELHDLARRADAICFGTLSQRSAQSRETVQRFVGAASRLRVLDVNFRQGYHSEAVVLASLELADVVKLSDEEVPLLRGYAGGPEDVDAFLMALVARFGLRCAVLTLGARGCRVFGPEGMAVSEGEPQAVVNAVGAGDAFAAAFAGHLLVGADIQTCADRANAVGAFVVTQDGATPVLPEDFRIYQ